MLFLDVNCSTLGPILKLLRRGVVPLLQIGIIAILVVLLIIDFGKAVMAGKEDEIKAAQKLAIKRVIYALIVFLVPWVVGLAIGLLADAQGADDDPYGKGKNALSCWNWAERKCTIGDVKIADNGQFAGIFTYQGYVCEPQDQTTWPKTCTCK